jgi:hypothetical protein
MSLHDVIVSAPTVLSKFHTDQFNQFPSYSTVTVFCSVDAAICSPKQAKLCWSLAMQKFITDNVRATCGCRRQCRKTTYDYIATQSEFSENMILFAQKNWGLNFTREEWRRNFAAFEVIPGWFLSSSGIGQVRVQTEKLLLIPPQIL